MLFTLGAERYERWSLGITFNPAFCKWEPIFANHMATAAAINRAVLHAVVLEFNDPGCLNYAAQQRSQSDELNRPD